MSAADFQRDMLALMTSLKAVTRRFDSVTLGRVRPLDDYNFALDTLRSESDPQELRLQGNFLYATDDQTGKVYVRFDDRNGPRIPVSAGFSLSGVDYSRVFLDWPAQSGKVARLVYGISANLAPPTTVGTINAIASPVDVTEWAIRQALNGKAYSTHRLETGVAAQYGHMWLCNQSLDRYLVVTATSAIYEGANATATLRSAAQATVTALALADRGYGNPHLVDAAASTAGRLYSGTNASAATGSPLLRSYAGSATTQNAHQPRDVFVIPPGYCLGWVGNNVNVAFTGQFSWAEVAL